MNTDTPNIQLYKKLCRFLIIKKVCKPYAKHIGLNLLVGLFFRFGGANLGSLEGQSDQLLIGSLILL